VRAYHEWMPTRVDPRADVFAFYRSFQFGECCRNVVRGAGALQWACRRPAASGAAAPYSWRLSRPCRLPCWDASSAHMLAQACLAAC
jgi:hypothetical protein